MDVNADVMARVGERGRGAFLGVAGIWRSYGQGVESYQIRGSLEGDICNIKRGRLSRSVFAGVHGLSAWDAFGTESLPARKG